MISTDPSTPNLHLRVISAAIVLLAMTAAVSGVAGSASVLVWVVALIALTVFGASFYLKS
ncbi:hypothetical protein SAMN02745166_00343 [Prosthecobacter debontii]|uniref:Uncharacterized protein n=1 Tax=Prosthecobacter debontii TaxID=48467 RepID=A0A1T4WIR5_9BACT|nr:hypothetical protein [Prosthecobacter debontii]SKA77233.1 hypothetical protein SAMN02745166_00343 [Prosthecobacter debontii]